MTKILPSLMAGQTPNDGDRTRWTKATLRFNGHDIIATPPGYFDVSKWRTCWFDDDTESGKPVDTGREFSALRSGNCPGEAWSVFMNGPTAKSVSFVARNFPSLNIQGKCTFEESPLSPVEDDLVPVDDGFECSAASSMKGKFDPALRFSKPVVKFTLTQAGKTLQESFDADAYAQKHQDPVHDACIRNTKDVCPTPDSGDTSVALVGRSVDVLLNDPKVMFVDATSAKTLSSSGTKWMLITPDAQHAHPGRSRIIESSSSSKDFISVEVVTGDSGEFPVGSVDITSSSCWSKHMQWVKDQESNAGIIGAASAGGLLFLLALLLLVRRRRDKDVEELREDDIEAGDGDADASVMINNPIVAASKAETASDDEKRPQDSPAEDMSTVWRAPVRQHKAFQGDAPEGTKPYRLRFKKRKPIDF